MNNNMQFPNSDWYGSEQQNVYSNPPYFDMPSSPSFPSNPYTGGNSYVRPRKRRNPLPWVMLILFLIALCAACIGVFLYIPKMFPQITPPSSITSFPITSNFASTVISVNSHPTIVISNYSDAVHVHAGSANNKVLLQLENPTQSVFPLEGTSLPYTRNSDNIITINTDALIGDGTLDITVPRTTDLRLESDTIEVVGVSGQMNLSSSGSITVLQSEIGGQSVLSNDGGPISVIEDALSGGVKLSNNGGIITFNGSIDPKGTYTFDNNGGLIDVTLSRSSSFHLDVSGIIDTITTDFPGMNVQGIDFSSTSDFRANVGKSPRATLNVSINGDPIILHRGS